MGSNFVKLQMTLTAKVTTILVILLGIYDLAVVAFGGGEGVSVSAFFIMAGINRPMVIFSIGFVCGHLFGYMRPLPK